MQDYKSVCSGYDLCYPADIHRDSIWSAYTNSSASWAKKH